MISKHTQPLNLSVLYNTYKNTHKRLFLFDYDGTLTPIVSQPADAKPAPTLLHNLQELCKDPLNSVWVISGRDQHFLDTHLGHIPRLGFSSEHGSFIKKPESNDWSDMLGDTDMSWKDDVLEIFEKYTKRNPGTVIEQKKSSITWHYRNAVNPEEA
ncbi:trehalose-phosphatase [Cokeromyces recurvatus]|uniref:trehalose-phosphatase n=1 Tax=Cokeromyces recurvatus TaxID=90255 RepID=UPI00221E92D6|nr:trehalose-phosphatase [Cokeromyces recurvatus]KAI7904906.1 trehalose-phosphatase [Cokeromyces recurvatus]